MNVGAMEIAFVALVALLLFGPRRLPEIARNLGKALREFRRATNELSEELRTGLEDSPEEPRPGPRG